MAPKKNEPDYTPDEGPSGMVYDTARRGQVVVVDAESDNPAGGVIYGDWVDNKYQKKDLVDVQTIDEGRVEVKKHRVS